MGDIVFTKWTSAIRNALDNIPLISGERDFGYLGIWTEVGEEAVSEVTHRIGDMHDVVEKMRLVCQDLERIRLEWNTVRACMYGEIRELFILAYRRFPTSGEMAAYCGPAQM